MRILGLDLSSHTGYALLEDGKLLTYGLIEVSNPYPKDIFPKNVIPWSKANSKSIVEVIQKHLPIDVIAIERTNGNSRNRDSQAFLEYSHLMLYQELEKLNLTDAVQYLNTSQWKSVTGCRMTNLDKKNNKMAKTDKKIKKVTTKHLSVRMANEKFGLTLKKGQHNEADSLMLVLAAHMSSSQ